MAQKTAARLALAITCWLLLLTRWVWTFSYQTNDDQLLSWLLESHTFGLSDAAWGPYLALIGPALSNLYAVLPALPWYGLFFYGYLALVCSLLVYTALVLLHPRWGWWTAFLLVAAIGWAVFPEHWIGFNFTRAATLGAGAALLGESTVSPGHKQARWLRILVLVLAVCIRPQAALMGSLIGGAWLMLVRVQRASPGQRQALLVAGLMLVGTLVLPRILPGQIPVNEHDRVDGHNAYLDYGLIRPQWARNAQDSLLEEGLARWFDADTKAYDAAFFERATWPSWKASQRWKNFPDRTRWQAVRASQAPDTLPSIRTGSLLLSLILLHGLMAPSRQSNKYARWAMPLLILLTVLGLAAMAYFLKLPNRVLQPAFTLTVFGALLCLSSSTQRGPGRKWLIAAALAVGFWGIWPQMALRKKQSNAIEANRAIISRWWAAYPDSLRERPTLISLPVYMRLLVDGDPLANYVLPPDPWLIDGWVARLPSYQVYLAERLDIMSYDAQWCQWAEEGAVLISTQDNAGFFNRYLQAQYGLELVMEPIWGREGISAFLLTVAGPCSMR